MKNKVSVVGASFWRYYECHLAVIRARTQAQQKRSISFVEGYFYHRQGSTKRKEVMRLVRGGHSIAVVIAEIEKCDVR